MTNAQPLRRRRRKDYDVRLVDYDTLILAGMRLEVPFLELDARRDEAHRITREHLHKHGVEAGRNVVVFVSSNTNGFLVVLDCIFGVEVAQPIPADDESPVRLLQLPAGRAVTTTHIGLHSELMDAHAAVHDWCRSNKIDATGINWEVHGEAPEGAQVHVDVYYAVTA